MSLWVLEIVMDIFPNFLCGQQSTHQLIDEINAALKMTVVQLTFYFHGTMTRARRASTSIHQFVHQSPPVMFSHSWVVMICRRCIMSHLI